MAVKVSDVQFQQGDMKYDHFEEVIFEVRGEKYVGHSSGGSFNIRYEGPAWEVVQMIASKHSFFQFDDMTLDEIKEEWPTVEDMLNEVGMNNGIGCDTILDLLDVRKQTKLFNTLDEFE